MGENGKLYQDPLYGAKILTPLAVAIIDTPEFQRLAGLRQLGFSDLVYRGAVHTRLQHSIGTYFVCRTILRRIVQNHERLDLKHPGGFVSQKLRLVPKNSDLEENITTYQSCWRGVTEVVSAAALIHDLSHVPFGHTLEDEFTGIYLRHDDLANARLYAMLFNESSSLARVFSDDAQEHWLPKIRNEDLRRLIYVILSWKERIEPPCGFDELLENSLQRETDASKKARLQELQEWYTTFDAERLFHPFMSDAVGNTICADLLDYLPRDRQHLGMEPRFHTRLQRYLTVRTGTLYPNEGLRVSTMVTRKGRGGQRRDVATAVLDIMRERYEMSERVYYHHKKAAASAMLAKLVELAGDNKPRDDELIYPAPWQTGRRSSGIPHTVHLSDAEFIDYLGTVAVGSGEKTKLREMLYAGLRYRRDSIYRTLLVVDSDLAQASQHSISFFATELRGPKDKPDNSGRGALERKLAAAAGASQGEVIVYCPSPGMQSKLVDARLEISENRVLPLRVQRESFAYKADVDVLQQYYDELWRAYIFVSPSLFANRDKCRAVVDAFCAHYGIHTALAYRKVRRYDFSQVDRVAAAATWVFSAVESFLRNLPIQDVPPAVTATFLAEAKSDNVLQAGGSSGDDASARLTALFHLATLSEVIANNSGTTRLKKAQVIEIDKYRASLRMGSKPMQAAAREGSSRFADFRDSLLAAVLGGSSVSE